MVRSFQEIGTAIGKLVTDKNAAYGSSFDRSGKILEILFPDGVDPAQFRDLLSIARIVDKLFRIATRKDAFGESAYSDIAGYGILGVRADEIDVETQRDVELEAEAAAHLREASLDDVFAKAIPQGATLPVPEAVRLAALQAAVNRPPEIDLFRVRCDCGFSSDDVGNAWGGLSKNAAALVRDTHRATAGRNHVLTVEPYPARPNDETDELDDNDDSNGEISA